MIFLITIPHQRPASVAYFTDDADLIAAACEASEADSRDYPETIDESINVLADDMHGHIVVRSLDDIDLVGEYSGHQKYKVRAMAEGIENMLLLDY